MQKPTVLLSPVKSAIPSQGGVIDVLVRVRAPEQSDAAQSESPQKRLSLVIDRSGSMGGQPLEEALKCVEYIAGHVAAKDQVSVVVYDNRVQVLLPLSHVKSADDVSRLLAGVDEGGTTNLFGGWEEGAKQLEAGDEASISRVILLSDGQANEGLVDQEEIETHCRKWLAKGVSTTTVGLGRDFNEDLMIAMAKAGGGQQYYGQTAKDLFDNFDEELSLLQAMYMRKLVVKLVPAPGVIIEPLGDHQQSSDGTYSLRDLAFGAESWMALRLHVSPTAAGERRDLLAATVVGFGVDGHAIPLISTMLSLLAVDQTAHDALPVDDVVARRMQEVDFAKASLEISRLVKEGDVKSARKLVRELEKRFGGNAWLKVKLERLRELADRDPEMMRKEASFGAQRLYSRLSALSDIRFGVDETDLEMPAFLRRKAEEGKGRRSNAR